MNASGKPLPAQPGKKGATRTDLVAALAALTLLICLVLPVWAAAKPKTESEECRNNLRLVGQSFHAWLKAHGNRLPWRATLVEGGNYDVPVNGNCWVQFLWLSNYISSPKILACPAEGRQTASDWSRNAQGGFLHMNYRANAVGYFIGLDGREEAPKSLLSGDPHLAPSASGQTCDYANVRTAASLKPGDKQVRWKNKNHQGSGNILFYDGQVAEMTSEQLRQALPKTEAYHQDNHILLPR